MYVLDLLRDVNSISYKKMMGEFILYKDNIIFGGVYDNRFLIKKSEYTNSLGLKEEVPYSSAKPMLLLDIENIKEIRDIILRLVVDLK